jgi:hypothetical protein
MCEEQRMHFRKDRSLDELARVGNVAQFVSFAPEADVPPSQTYSRVAGYDENHKFASVSDAAVALLEAAPDRKVNVRSYAPESPRSREFVYGLERVEDVLANVKRLTREGLHVIVNETVDIEDGGVSGVVQSGVIEFAPDDTPRCVETAAGSGTTASRDRVWLPAGTGDGCRKDGVQPASQAARVETVANPAVGVRGRREG